MTHFEKRNGPNKCKIRGTISVIGVEVELEELWFGCKKKRKCIAIEDKSITEM